jgi:DNA-binding GntR family transcriptional regulator
MAQDGLDALSEQPLAKASTVDAAARALRELIVSGQLTPGTPLPEVRLAQLLKISRNTVREALRELEWEGLVQHNMHRGAAVATIAADDIRQIFELRRLIEFDAIREGHLDEDRLARLGEAIEALRAAADKNDWREVAERDFDFHQLIVQLRDNERIARIYDQLQSELRLCLLLADQMEPEPGLVVDQHSQVYEALVAGDRKKCQRLLAGHLAEAEAHLLEAYVANANGHED